jgi:hypothetical protein
LHIISRVIERQFGAFGDQPWFIEGVPGASYLKKEAEFWPFVREIYVPVASLVGPRHTLEAADGGEFRVIDVYEYEDRELTDDEFRDMLLAHSNEKYRSGPKFSTDNDVP